MSRVLIYNFGKVAESTIKDKAVVLHGITFPPSLDIQNIKDAISYVPNDDDIILAAYPNTGEEWLQHIVLKVVGRDNIFSAPDVTFKIVPVLERVGSLVVDSLYKPRIYRHNLPYHMVKKNPRSKCIYLYRNPEDTFASYYYHKNRIQGKKGNLEKAFEKFWSGRDMEYGRYFEHIRSFFRYQHSSNVLLVSFDKLYESHKEQVLRIAEFLDQEFYDYLLQSDSALENLLEKTAFEKVPHKRGRPHESSFAKRPTIEEENDHELREVTGGGKRLLSVNQVQKLHQISADVLKIYLSIYTQPAARAVAGTETVENYF